MTSTPTSTFLLREMDGSYNLPLASVPCGRPTKPCPPCPAASPISSSSNFLMYSDKVLITSLDGRQDSSAFNFYLNPSLDKFRWDVLSMQLQLWYFQIQLLDLDLYVSMVFTSRLLHTLKAIFHYFNNRKSQNKRALCRLYDEVGLGSSCTIP